MIGIDPDIIVHKLNMDHTKNESNNENEGLKERKNNNIISVNFCIFLGCKKVHQMS